MAAILEPALERCGGTLDDVQAALDSGHAQLWELGDSAVVTQVCDGGRTLRVWLAGGNLDKLRRGLPVLDEVAREFGCSRIEIEGRKGWARVLTGYRVDRVFLVKEVE